MEEAAAPLLPPLPAAGSALQGYAELLKAHPLAVGMPQQAVIMALANIAKQALASRRLRIRTPASSEQAAAGGVALGSYAFAVDWPAAARAAFLGGVCMAPVLHMWYRMLNRHVGSAWNKTLVDQLLAAWALNAYAQWALAILHGEPFAFTVAFVRLVVTSWCWWIPIKGAMFTMVPEHFWLPFSALGSFGWNVIMFSLMDR